MREHEAAVSRLQAENDRLQKRIDAMYVDKLDGRVDAGFLHHPGIRRSRAGTPTRRDQGQHLLPRQCVAHAVTDRKLGMR
jgi:hypothetical protein